jgi:hypothetical protein
MTPGVEQMPSRGSLHPARSAPLNMFSSLNLYPIIIRPVIVPALNRDEPSPGDLGRQGLGMINRDDRVAKGSNDLNWTRVPPQ